MVFKTAKILLAILKRMYYTIQVEHLKRTCRCDGMVDVVDSKSTAGDSVPVRVRPPAPKRFHSRYNVGYGILLFSPKTACFDGIFLI